MPRYKYDKVKNKMAARSLLEPFLALRSILENLLLEEMCSELKTALYNVLKVVLEEIFYPTKNILNTFETIF